MPKYPKYPKGIAKMDDYVGRRVRLKHDVETKGKNVWPKGSRFTVDGHYRGRLTLRLHGGQICIRGVGRYEVDLLPK